MKRVLRLARGFLLQHPVRLALTLLATVAATSLVLWMVSGYESLLRSHDVFAERALGRYTLSVDPIRRRWDRRVLPETIEALRADPDVTAAEPMWAERVVVQSKAVKLQAPPPGSGSQPGEGVNECLLLGTDAPDAPFDVVSGEWVHSGGNQDPSSDPIEAAVSSQIADRYGLDLGDDLTVGLNESAFKLRVVGIIDNPPVPITGRTSASITLPSPSIAGIYTSMEDAAIILRRDPVATFVGLQLRDGVDVHAFRYAWGPKLSRFAEPAQFQEDHDLEEQLDEAAAAENLRLQAYAATLMAMLLAFLVIFNTLNMGVSERTRQFAMLRAIVLTRAEVAWVVFGESLIIAAAGFIGGLVVGQGLLSLAGSFSNTVLRHGAQIGALGVTLSAVASFGAALLAACIPAWRATRVRPLDAMAPPQASVTMDTRWRWGLGLVGLILIGVAPLLTFAFPPSNSDGALAHLAGGLFALASGFLLLAPGVVWLVDRFVGPVVAWLIGLNRKLLEQQLSCHMGRTVASAIALSVGLTLFISLQVWGYTMLETFVPGVWAPDMLVELEPYGVTQEATEQIAQLPSVDADRCAPFLVEQPRLREDITGSAERATVTRQDNVVLIGIDPAKAIGGEAPLLAFTYLQGDRESALASMRNGRGCIVPEHFLRETGLKLGDQFELVPPENPEQPAAYTIAASVRFQGWHWITKIGGLRIRTHRAAAMVIASFEDVAEDFDLHEAKHLWLRYATPMTTQADVTADIRGCYARVLGEEVLDEKPKSNPVDALAAGHGRPAAYIHAVSAEQVRQGIRGVASRWLWAASVLPLVAVVIGCLGVLTVIVSSVRARRWEMGILRSLGFTRGDLIRLVVAEGLLVGVIACCLSLGFGIMAGWCGTGLTQYMSFFGGMQPVLVVPPLALTVGLLVVLLFAAMVAVFPAVGVGRTHPLRLLQEGRSAL